MPAGYPIQPNPINFFSDEVAMNAAETLFTLTPVRNAVAGSTGTSLGLAAGKNKMWLETITFNLRITTAGVIPIIFRIRANPAGAAIVSSPVIAGPFCVGNHANAVQDSNCVSIRLGDNMGLQLLAGWQLCVTHIAPSAVVTGQVSCSIAGFEY